MTACIVEYYHGILRNVSYKTILEPFVKNFRRILMIVHVEVLNIFCRKPQNIWTESFSDPECTMVILFPILDGTFVLLLPEESDHALNGVACVKLNKIVLEIKKIHRIL